MNDSEDAKNIKYNFVFFFVQSDYWKAIIGPSNECMHVYDWTFGNTVIGKFISRLYWSNSIRCKIKLPFKRLFFKRMYEQTFENDKPLCFVYLGGNSIRFDDGWCEYIRKRDPRNKQVVLHGDLISKKINWDYEELRNKMDLCSTYDKEEAQRYGIHYYRGTVYTRLIPEEQPVQIENDMYFLAAVKDRLLKIMNTYHYLHNSGVKCKFILVGVPDNQQIPYDGIEYSNGITYEENLRNVIRSKCVLELVQGGSSDITLRAKEAIAYRRRLVTDCQLVNREFFNENQLQVIKRPEDIDISMIVAELNPDDYPIRPDMNPINRLVDIQQALETQ